MLDRVLDQAWIAAHIPHQGTMCLLDEVVSWDEARIACRASSHRAPDHPLRTHGRLGAACGIESAAQAMAVLGALSLGLAVLILVVLVPRLFLHRSATDLGPPV